MELELTQGKVALIDDEDAERVRGYGWYAAKTSYGTWKAVATVPGTRGQTKISLHRLIAGAPAGTEVDHVNRDTLDNRRANLRVGSTAQNQQNTRARRGTSRFKGVAWNTRKGKWRVMFNWQGETFFVGYFADEEEAARAYDARISALAGEWAVLNFPGTESGTEYPGFRTKRW